MIIFYEFEKSFICKCNLNSSCLSFFATIRFLSLLLSIVSLYSMCYEYYMPRLTRPTQLSYHSYRTHHDNPANVDVAGAKTTKFSRVTNYSFFIPVGKSDNKN